MAWFTLDDSMWSHPKFLRLSDKAFRLWVRAGAYCAQHLTDGLVTTDTLIILGAHRRTADELWAAGLWERAPDDAYRFHDWTDYQFTREQVERRRAHDRERKAKAREAKQLNRLRAVDEPDDTW